jgi:hypothetical protein
MDGYIYAFTTPSMPGVVKIGATDRDPAHRLAEANAQTWAPPVPYVAAFTAPVANAFATERAVHALLAARRVNPRREFFALTDDEARALFAMVAQFNLPPNETAVPVPRAAAPVEPVGEREKLRQWVEAHYTRVPLREKDTGTKLMTLYYAYTNATPPVHAKLLGRNTFGKMLNAVYPNVGPHNNNTNTVSGIYLLR